MDFVDFGDDDPCQYPPVFANKEELEKEYTALKSKENEDQIELRRLRTENRLLRQRIDNLEKESASLADRLIQYQLTRAQEAEDTYALKNELSLTKQKFTTSQKQLKEAESLIGDIKERTDSIHSASSLDEGEAQVVVQSLQEELIMVRLREAENTTTIKNLNNKIVELQQYNTRLQQAPSNDVQCLQEELIAVKLREAEANLSLKEMRQSISDLEVNWQRHLSSSSDSSPREKSNSKSELKNELKKAQEDLMTSKLKEAGALSALKDAKQKIMELETSNQICTNQIRRMDEENKKQRGDIDDQKKAGDDAQKQIKSLLRKIDDLESKHREELMMARIREAENDQAIGELKQQIAHMEIQKEELLAADSLENKGGKQDLHNTIFDLQEEVMQLKMSAPSPKSPNTSASSANSRVSNKLEDEDEYNDDDDDDIEDPESLNRTLSEIIEGKRSSTSLIAILNRENSDCDTSSVSSESSYGHKLVKTNSFKGERIEEKEAETSEMVEIDLTDKNGNGSNTNNALNCDSAEGQVNNSAIHQSAGGTLNQTSEGRQGSQSSVQTGSVSDTVGKVKHNAMTVNQSNDIAEQTNGEVTTYDVDANENLHSKGANGSIAASSKTQELSA